MVTINIEKRHLIVFCLVIGLAMGMFFAYAYKDPPTWPGNAANFGHSVDEINWNRPIQASVEVRSIGAAGPALELVKGGGQPIDPMFILWGDIASGIKSDERMRVTREGNVGIGTTTPAAKLDVNGQIKISGGSPGVGRVLTSDASGLAAWQIPSGDITDVIAGTGLTGGGASGSVTLIANTVYLQRRVTDTCPAGQAIRVIAPDGTVTCTSVTAICTWSGIQYSTGANCRESACNPSLPIGCSGAALAWARTCQTDGSWGPQYCGMCSLTACGT